MLGTIESPRVWGHLLSGCSVLALLAEVGYHVVVGGVGPRGAGTGKTRVDWRLLGYRLVWNYPPYRPPNS